MSILKTIHNPADLKRLKPAHFPKLCPELGEQIIGAVCSVGGQLGSNLENVATLERDIAGAGPQAGQPGSQPTPRLSRTRYVAPEYPAGARKKGVRGDVRVRITVDAEGRVSDAVVVQSNPPEIFDAVAVAAARKWRFKSIGAKDSGVEATATVDIAFRPEDMKK